jgi:addiction module RelE/StbE family toxin
MRVEYSNTAFKNLKKLPRAKQIKILKTIEKLKNDPYAGKNLKGEFEGLRSLRVWPYRIIYRYIAQEKLIFVNVISHRQGVYK